MIPPSSRPTRPPSLKREDGKYQARSPLLPLILGHFLSHSSFVYESCRNVSLCTADADSPLFVLRLLLKYVGRDEISLLGRGTGGVTELRGTIEGYDENSPLYGFLQYRRRKVILRYMPEGMSRLLQGNTFFGGTPHGMHARSYGHSSFLLSFFIMLYISVCVLIIRSNHCSSHDRPVPVLPR